MLRHLVGVMLLLLLSILTGCSWQASNASQAVDFNPFAIGSGQQVFSPSNSYGYVNGEAMDMRSRR
jgi:hypothetical protein